MTVAPGGVAVVLRDLSLSVREGGLTALLGPSGAGKTTLLRAIAGLERSLAGTIALGGRDLAGVPAHRRRIAVVFQEPRLLPHLDVVENVAFPLRAGGVGRAARRSRALVLLDEVGLSGLASRGVQGLSGGEQQRVSLARALCAEPELLMLDEPLASLDPNRREGLRRLIAAVQRERGLTTLLITHDRGEAAELGERIALMIDGAIVQHDDPRALFERPSSVAVARFFGSVNVLRGEVRRGRMRVGEATLDVVGADGPASFTIRPERVRVGVCGMRLRVTEAIYQGLHVRLALAGCGLELEAQVPTDRAPPAGSVVGVELPRESLWRLPR